MQMPPTHSSRKRPRQSRMSLPRIRRGAITLSVLLALLTSEWIPSMAFTTPVPVSRTRYYNANLQTIDRASVTQPVRRQFMKTSGIDLDEINNNSSNNHNPQIRPQHVAIICDGNSRWAKQRNLPTSTGHMEGANRLVELLEVLADDGISYCTLYGFSTENWNRSQAEIDEIFTIMEETARKLLPRVLRERSRFQIRVLGNMDDVRVPKGLQQALQELQSVTQKITPSKDNRNPLTVSLAINYGGRHDIVQATKRLAAAMASGEMSSDDVSEETLTSYLNTAGIPDPDLLIRTSGEYRLSNFLLWNLAYTELYFTDVLWPDFDKDCWSQALQWYRQRQRRFGGRATSQALETSSAEYE